MFGLGRKVATQIPASNVVALPVPWPDFHAVAVSQGEIWRFMCFYAARISESVIERNLIPKPAMGYIGRFQYFHDLYDYDRAYAELPSSGYAKPEKIMANLNNNEIFVLLRASYRELGDELERYRGAVKPRLARMMELAELVRPDPPPSDGE